MILFKKANDLHNYLDQQRKKGKSVGFVPTMGALHKGHISLIRKAGEAGGLCISSIFVNPTQFNDPADFEKYPVTIENDIRMLELAGCDVLFLPSVTEIYPEGTAKRRHYELGYLETVLEGKYRPGHFQGVCLVVHLLLAIVRPDDLYLGQKDYQQCMVIRHMIGTTELADIVTLHISPTVREDDGLAMSSRNTRLNQAERKRAPAIIESLRFIKTHLRKGDLRALKQQAVSQLTEKGFRVDYVEIADADTLQLVTNWDGQQRVVALVAAFLNEVRLIDNILLN